MKIEHVAIWVNDLEGMREFYELNFGGKSNEKYYNKVKEFESYFIEFSSGARLEVMRKKGINKKGCADMSGWAHIAFSVGSKEAVDEITMKLKSAGVPVINGPRTTGDGYYESVIEDPEGNEVEIIM